MEDPLNGTWVNWVNQDPSYTPGGRVHVTAMVHPSATICENSEVGADSVVGPRCFIGPNARISHRVLIGHDSRIDGHPGYAKPDFVLYSHVQVGEGVRVREGAKIYHRCHLARGVTVGAGTCLYPHASLGPQVVVGDSCVIAAEVSVDVGAAIRDRVRIGSLSSIGRVAHLGDGCVLGAGVTIAAGVHIDDGVSLEYSPFQAVLPRTVVHFPSPGHLGSGCVRLPLDQCTPDAVEEHCYRAGYRLNQVESYCDAIAWMIDKAKQQRLYVGHASQAAQESAG